MGCSHVGVLVEFRTVQKTRRICEKEEGSEKVVAVREGKEMREEPLQQKRRKGK